jgi:hypothetical protein
MNVLASASKGQEPASFRRLLVNSNSSATTRATKSDLRTVQVYVRVPDTCVRNLDELNASPKHSRFSQVAEETPC